MTISDKTSTDSELTKRSLGEEFESLLVQSNGNGVSLSEAMHALKGRGMAVVMLIVSIPFLIPVPTTFGLSTPAGLGVMLLGLYIMIGREPHLPQWMGRRRLTHGTLERVVWFTRKYEKWVKPRLKFMTWPGIDRLLGASIIFGGFTLGLPGPNFIPALAVVCLLIGLIERDGLFVLLGQLVNLLLLAFLIFVTYLVLTYGYTGAKSMVEQWWSNGSSPATQPVEAQKAATQGS
ncbi:MAG: hypothetical protein KatS3mg104_0429 [Phycisphaerae bacterium]|jgi:hypothetical protein|nr:MAG: hypothetical protein KatS3mg104_0429 [Phycisphaerae bacterium]